MDQRTWEDKETRNWHEIKEVTVKCDRRYTLKRQKWFPVSLRGILQAVLRDSSCKIPALSVAGSTSNNPEQGSELNHTWKISTIVFVERHLIQSQYSLPVKTKLDHWVKRRKCVWRLRPIASLPPTTFTSSPPAVKQVRLHFCLFASKIFQRTRKTKCACMTWRKDCAHRISRNALDSSLRFQKLN